MIYEKSPINLKKLKTNFKLKFFQDLFKSCGNTFIDPNDEDDCGVTQEEKEDEKKRKQTVRIKNNDENTKSEKKGGCC